MKLLDKEYDPETIMQFYTDLADAMETKMSAQSLNGDAKIRIVVELEEPGEAYQ
jgi:hypothetical protein